MRVWYVIVGASAVTGFAALGLAALPAKGRGFLVNLIGFWLPAVATIGDTDKAMDHPNKPCSFTGYWVRADDAKLFSQCVYRLREDIERLRVA